MRAALFAAVLAACGAREHAVTDVAEAVTAAQETAKPEVRDLVGVIVSKRTEVVPAPFAGRLVRLWVRAGQQVVAGDRIASFDHADLDTQILELRADERAASLAASASFALAEVLHVRHAAQARLVMLGAAAPMSATTAGGEWRAKVAEGAAEQARGGKSKARRELLERQRGKAELVASIDGVVMQLGVKDGEVIAAGAPLARIYDRDHLLVRFAVPAELRGALATGQRIEFRIDGSARPVAATIERIATEPPPINFTVVEASIADADRFDPDIVRVAATGSVRLAAARGGQP